MNISAKSRYALRALVELELCAGDPAAPPMRVAELASRRGLPEQYLEQLFAALRRAGVLRSYRGVGGGFAFARRPATVTVLDVVTALDGPLSVAACTEGACDLEGSCGAAELWRDAEVAFEGVLAACSIADLAERERHAAAGQPMYEI
jgi:Rrf2 family transcriptional regulator, cysteine metabolism repressor